MPTLTTGPLRSHYGCYDCKVTWYGYAICWSCWSTHAVVPKLMVEGNRSAHDLGSMGPGPDYKQPAVPLPWEE